ncbi:MAG: class I mannose-6-phosphate isomerase, partial [Oscillospiraceae bacterium]
CRCAYFQIERMLLNTEICREMAQMSTYHNSFQVLLCVDGCGVIQAPGGNGLPFFKGDCIFVPANSAQLFLHGRAELLRVSC